MKTKKIILVIYDNAKTLIGALIIAVLIRSLFQPFYIPSSSMEPTLLVGDRIFVSKYPTDIVSIHFLLVQIFQIIVFFQNHLKEEIWSFLKHPLIIEQIISKD